MKKIIVLMLAALNLFTACGKNSVETPNEVVITGEKTAVTTDTTTAMILISSMTETQTAVKSDTVEEPAEEERIYFFSEIDEALGSGSFSVNSLSEKYNLIQAFGIGYNHNYNAIIAEYDGISFHMVNNFNKQLSFEKGFIIQEPAPLTDEDKDVFIKPYLTVVTSDRIDLPRNIKIGSSRQDVINSYDGDTGYWKWGHNEIFEIKYSYRPEIIERYTDDEQFNLEAQTGSVSYCFENEYLVKVEIRWFNGYLAFD